ncbi:putative ribonuclease H-like domain-containing protein [Tanacetum coccineum]
MADNRTMAQMLQAPIEGYEDAIVVPPINANNFELKQPLINLVQNIQKFRTLRLSFCFSLSPITLLDVQFDTPSPSPPIVGHPIPWNLLEAHVLLGEASDNFVKFAMNLLLLNRYTGLTFLSSIVSSRMRHIFDLDSHISKSRGIDTTVSCLKYCSPYGQLNSLGIEFELATRINPTFHESSRVRCLISGALVFSIPLYEISLGINILSSLSIKELSLHTNKRLDFSRNLLNQLRTRTVPENNTTSTPSVSTGSQPVNTGRLNHDDSLMPELEIFHKPETGIFDKASYDEEGLITDFNSLPTAIEVSPTPTLRIHSIHPKSQILGDPKSAVQTRSKEEPKKIAEALQDDNYLRMKREWHNGSTEINEMKAVCVVRNKADWWPKGYTQEERYYYDEVFAPVQDRKLIKVYKVVKALYGLHQAPRAWYATLSTFLEKHGYKRGTIDKTLFIRRNKKDIMLVQVSIDQDAFDTRDEEALDVDVITCDSKRTYSSPYAAQEDLLSDYGVQTWNRKSITGWLSIYWSRRLSLCNVRTDNCGHATLKSEYVACCKLLWTSIVGFSKNQLLD